jgi:hypothetical protein
MCPPERIGVMAIGAFSDYQHLKFNNEGRYWKMNTSVELRLAADWSQRAVLENNSQETSPVTLAHTRGRKCETALVELAGIPMECKEGSERQSALIRRDRRSRI